MVAKNYKEHNGWKDLKMSLSKISDISKQEEIDIQNQINCSIDRFEHIAFNAGAGAGKTFALIESLKYIIKTHGKKLMYHNQKIICITYTNVATSEIKDRLGNSELIKVSTIHERLWDLIKDYKKELLKIHVGNLEQQLELLNFDLSDNPEDNIIKQYSAYRKLHGDVKDKFKESIISKKELFYKSYDKSAGVIKAVFKEYLDLYPDILKNVAHFKKIVNTIFKIDNYMYCLDAIKAKKDRYKTVKYDSKYNTDILHRMLISHDTLIDYSLKIVNDYDLLKQVILDSHPYILIDEFQDTNAKVVTIMKLIADHAKRIQHKVFIGYFGDTVQNIYDDGVGNKINEIHPNLKLINKKFNRRSHKEIIDVINKIRNDQIDQISIYDDSTGGSVKFYTGKDEYKQKFIEKYQLKWNINANNKLHCLVLTNKLVAEFSGFINIYNHFSNTSFYRKNYNQLKTELLSNDLSKLGVIPNLFYRIIKFKSELENTKTPLINIFNKKIYAELTFSELNKIIVLLKSIRGESLGEYIKSIFNNYEKSDNEPFKQIINQLMNLERYSYHNFINYLLDKLFPNLDSEDVGNAKNTLEELLTTDFSEYISWCEFIKDEQQADIVYHTYHGTKGAEFDNVIILMENDFGVRDRDKFSSFFKNIKKSDTMTGEASAKFNNTKNLLYVSCSRAIQNLRVLYLDNVSDFRDGVEDIFGEVYQYEI